jgi:hypothetical protein
VQAGPSSVWLDAQLAPAQWADVHSASKLHVPLSGWFVLQMLTSESQKVPNWHARWLAEQLESAASSAAHVPWLQKPAGQAASEAQAASAATCALHFLVPGSQ